MNNRKKKITCLLIVFVLLLSYSPIFNNLFLDGSFLKLSEGGETGDGTLSMFNESVSECDDLQETIYYNFTADLIDLGNSSHVFDAGYLETEFKDGTWFSPYTDNITIGDLINYNNYIPGFDDFYAVVGNLSGWVDLSLNEANDGLYSIFYSTEVEHFPATFSFTNDTIGGDPANFSVDELAGTVNVIEYLDGHRNVVEMFDDDNTDFLELMQTFSSADREYGVIEWWWRTDDATEPNEFYLENVDTATMLFLISIRGDDFDYYDGAWHEILSPALDNTWYHLKVIFECSLYGYEGLDQYTYRVFINEIEYGDYPFWNNEPNVDRVGYQSTVANAVVYSQFIDAIGYGWLDDYNIGDNYNWNYYPATHDFEKYNVTLSGNYYGSYSFEEDLVGNIPDGWTDASGTDCSATITDDIFTHNKVLYIFDDHLTDIAEIYTTFTSQTSGTVEFWWLCIANTYVFIRLFDDASYGPHLTTINNDFKYEDGGWQKALDRAANVWYHHRIDFECGAGGYMGLGADTYDWYIDNVLVANDIGFIGGNLDGFNKLHIQSTEAQDNSHTYFDAFAYSWDPSYCQIEDTWNFDNDYKSWNKNPYNLSSVFPDNWDYYGVLGGTYSIDGEFGNHKKYLEIYDDSDTDYYKGTYSFEGDAVNSRPVDWDYVSGTGTDTVIAFLDGHRKVYEMDDTAALNYRTEQIFTDGAQTSGTIEWWWRMDNVVTQNEFQFYDGATQVFKLIVVGGDFKDAGGIVRAAVVDTWYHHRIDFECGAGGYMGLATDTYDWYIDGVLERDDRAFVIVGDSVSKIRSQTGGGAVMTVWYDAVSYSWDENHIIDLYPYSDNSIPIGTQVWNTFDSNQTTGTLSFWINGDFDRYFRIYLMQDIDFSTSIKINGSELWYVNNKTWTLGNDTVSNDWHYVRITFNTTADTYDLWFDYSDYTYDDDGINFNLTLVASDIPFQQDVTGIDRIMFETESGYPVKYKVDALLYSWVNSTIDLNLIPINYVGSDTLGYAELDFKVALYVGDPSYIAVCLYWSFLTSSDEYVNFTWYNFDTDTWDVITRDYFDGDVPPVGFTEHSNCSDDFDSTWLDPYVNASGYLLFRVSILDFGEEFEFYFDELRVLVRSYVQPNIRKSFCWKGIWRYRWVLRIDNGTMMWTNYTYFEVIPLDSRCNFEGVSESQFTTYWELIGSGITPIERFSDDIGGGSWDLYGVSDRFFRKSFSDSNNYLLDNYSYYDVSYVSPAQWGEFSFTKGSGGATGELETNNGNYGTIDSSAYVPPTWRYITTCPMTTGSCSGTIANAKIDDGNYFTLTAAMIMADVYILRTDYLGFNVAPDGSAQYISYYLWSSSPDVKIYINDVEWKTGSPHLNADNQYHSGVNNVRFYATDTSAFTIRVYYFRMDDVDPVNAKIDVSATWTIPEGDPLTFDYDYKTTVAVDCDLDIYNWDTTGWLELQSHTSTSWYTSSYGLTDPYISVSNQVKIRFQTAEYAGNFDLQLDQIVIAYGDIYNISKNYFGGGYTYMQTNITETLTLRSTPYGTNYTVYEGEYFEIELESTASDILMNLYSGGVLSTILTVLSDNTDSGRRTIGVSILSDITFDQIEFVGIDMDDTELFICYDIFGGGYEATDLYYDMFVDPDGKDCLMAQVGVYLLRVWEQLIEGSWTLQIEKNTTLTYDLLTEIYVPEIPEIEWNLKIYHYAYELSTIEIYSVNETDYTTTLVVNTTAGKDEILDYYLTQGEYIVNWTNGENGVLTSYNVSLNYDRSLILSTTYFSVYFGLFTYDGLGLNRDWVRFYINGTRKDFGLNVVQSASVNITVLDYFNNTLASEIIDASAYFEYNIYAQVYSMYILNQFTYSDLIFNITQVGSGYNMTQLIPSSSALLYRFIPNINYTIEATYVNGTVYSIRTVNLTDNSQIESFGIASVPEEYPKDVYFGVYTTTGLGVDRDLLRFYIDGDRTDFGFNRIENMIVTVLVRDYFNSTLFNQNVNTSGIYEYNILITLYSLKIKNEAQIYSNYTLNFGVLNTTGYILPEEIIVYQLSSNNYVFDYTNNEDNSFHTININLNQNRVYILNTTYYNGYFSLYDLNLHIIDSSQYVFRLNGTIQDFGLIVDLSTDDYNISVVDRFGTSLFDSIVTLRGLNEYRIDITLYELQIRHLAREIGNMSLYETTIHNSFNFSMAPDTIRSFILGSSTYNITWTNGENGIETVYDINLNLDYILTLDSTYFDVYFSAFNYDGLGLDKDLFRFYINGLRKDFGFNTLEQDTNNLKVLDYFNATLFDSNIALKQYTEYNLFVEVYALIINNNYSFSIKIEIEREDVAITFEQVIGAQFGMPYRFLPNIEYYIKAYHINGTLLDERIVELDKNNKIVSFGFYSEEIPVIPDFNAPGIWLMIILILMVCGFAIALVGYLAYRYRKKSENYRRSYADKITLEAQTIKKFSQGTRIR